MVIEGDSSFTIPDDASVVQPRECGTPEGDSSKPTFDRVHHSESNEGDTSDSPDVTTTQLLDHVTGIIGD